MAGGAILRRWCAGAIALAVLVAGLATPVGAGRLDKPFAAFIATKVVPATTKAGLARNFVTRELAGLTPALNLPGLRPPGAKAPPVNYQAEFRFPDRYFRNSQFGALVKIGRQMLRQHRATLEAVEKQFGVPRRIVLAIWARESAYGRAKIPHDAIRVLATRAFMGQRRDFFLRQLVAGLTIRASGAIARDQMRASWGGALGHPQFLPESFLKYAVDFDGDGRRDIWRSIPDILASIANYLKQNGWVRGRDWGFEANVPASVSCTREGPDIGQPIAAWVADGVTRVAGRKFPTSELTKPGYLLMPAGRRGPAFIATQNFYVLKTYNESDTYALFVGHLADRMARNIGFVGKWRRPAPITRGAVRDLQAKLIKSGWDVGAHDGLIGYKTRRALGTWQLSQGRPATCWTG
ncbi:MAG: lytic murein transglycosylase [Alphaproteobacteria bacterium]